MTDPEMADRTYIEPLTPEFVAKIIERERPDALLPTRRRPDRRSTSRWPSREDGTLDRYGVELIGAKLARDQDRRGPQPLRAGRDGAPRPRHAEGFYALEPGGGDSPA